MTFREVLEVIWSRRLTVVAVTLLVLLVAAGFSSQQDKVYTAMTTLRMNPAATAASEGGSQGYGGIEVDFDPSTISAPVVAQAAARQAGERESALGGQITYHVTEGARTNKVDITALGPSPESAQRRAYAVATAYTSYLQDQIDAGTKRLETQRAATASQVTTLQSQLSNNPKDNVIATYLASAVQSLGEIDTRINDLANTGPPTTVLTKASPGELVGTSPPIRLAVAFTVGLLGGIGIALTLAQFDDRLHDAKKVRTVTDAPVLGELVLDRSMATRDEHLPAARPGHSALKEGISALRTSLQVAVPKETAVVAITSVEPGDGKSFVSANLALTWAKAGKRVILVGGDLRRPRLETYFPEAAKGPGLSELLTMASEEERNVTLSEVDALVQETEFRGLRILPAGAPPQDPADLLASSALAWVLDRLASLAEVVVVDAPPVLTLADASLIAARTDGAVLLFSLRRTNSDRLDEAVRAMRSTGVTVLGVVANRSKRKQPKSYGAYNRDDDAKATTSSLAWRRSRRRRIAVHGRGKVSARGHSRSQLVAK